MARRNTVWLFLVLSLTLVLGSSNAAASAPVPDNSSPGLAVQPTTAVAPGALPPAAITELRASKAVIKVQLNWPPVTVDEGGGTIGGVTYNVYRAQDDPYFVPEDGSSYAANIAAPSWTDGDMTVLLAPAHSTYYLVKGVYSGLLAKPSNRVGAFVFRLGAPCPADNASGSYYSEIAITSHNCPLSISPPEPGVITVTQQGETISITIGGQAVSGTFVPADGSFSLHGFITDSTICPALHTCEIWMDGTFQMGQEPLTYSGTGRIEVRGFLINCTVNFVSSGVRVGCPAANGGAEADMGSATWPRIRMPAGASCLGTEVQP